MNLLTNGKDLKGKKDDVSEPKILHAGKYLNLVERDGWEYVTRTASDVVIILPVLSDGRIVLIKEFRKPLQKYVVGLPAGLVGDHGEEGIFDAAIRELVEETGYRASRMELVLENSPSSSGMTTETFNLLIATKLVRVGNGGGDDSEDIEVLEINPDEIKSLKTEWLSKGYVVDPKIYMGLYFLNS
jgi:ADP-ribose pyrophosphatase